MRATARVTLDTARALLEAVADYDGIVIVNDRTDVAIAAGAAGVQLGVRSIPVAAARAWAQRSLSIGYSAHSVGEAEQAVTDGADYVVLGTIWPSASHPGECSAGVSMLAEAAGHMNAPLYAIGGVTPARAREAVLAGAHGAAVISGVWDHADPAAAALEYVQAMQEVETGAA
jgi:thiamine-phosphate diphosphorylase